MKIGDTVLCVDSTPPAKPSRRRVPQGYVEEGKTYTITGLDREGGLILNCKKVEPSRKDGLRAIGWKPSRFRVVERRLLPRRSTQNIKIMSDIRSTKKPESAARTGSEEACPRCRELEGALDSMNEGYVKAVRIGLDQKDRIQELETAREWIPVERRLPDDGIVVLIFDRWNLYRLCTHDKVAGWQDQFAGGTGGITHWMPLPSSSELQATVVEDRD